MKYSGHFYKGVKMSTVADSIQLRLDQYQDLFSEIEWAFNRLEEAKIDHYLDIACENGENQEDVDVTDALADIDGLEEAIISTIEEWISVKKEPNYKPKINKENFIKSLETTLQLLQDEKIIKPNFNEPDIEHV